MTVGPLLAGSGDIPWATSQMLPVTSLATELKQRDGGRLCRRQDPRLLRASGSGTGSAEDHPADALSRSKRWSPLPSISGCRAVTYSSFSLS